MLPLAIFIVVVVIVILLVIMKISAVVGVNDYKKSQEYEEGLLNNKK